MKDLLNAFIPLKKVSKQTKSVLVTLEVLLFLSLWQFIDFSFLPKPLDVLKAFVTLYEDGLLREIFVSFWLNVEAILWSTLISLAFVYLTVFEFMKPITKALSKLRFMGLVGWTFVFTMLASSSHMLKVMLLVFGMSVFFITSMLAVIEAIPKEEYDYAKTLKLNNWQIIWHVIIYGRASEAMEILRQNAAMGWMMLTMVEGIARAEGGIGTVLLSQNKFFKLDAVFAALICVLIIGLAQDGTIAGLRKGFFPHSALEEKK